MRRAALSRNGSSADCRGQALIEFAMAAVIILALILAVVEFGRIVLVYTTVADSARIGARYAITHASIPGGGAVTSTNVASMQSSVQTVVKSFLAPATVNINSPGLIINTSFANISCTGSGSTSTCTGTTPGNPVQVTVSYPYNLLVSYFPMNVTLTSTSEGVITW